MNNKKLWRLYLDGNPDIEYNAFDKQGVVRIVRDVVYNVSSESFSRDIH